jgi:histidinol-phosphate/aromatic aminotransferase/cobyric acid decarboxylase-like protein
MEQVTTPAALAEAAQAARVTAQWRAHLLTGLRRLGLRPQDSAAPFVLVEVGAGVREALRDKGYAARRGDTFPGLGPQWLRLAVRDPLTTDGLLRELAAVLVDQEERSA